MRIALRALIILIFTINFANDFSLNAQSSKKSLSTMLSANSFLIEVDPNQDYQIERFFLAKSKDSGTEQVLSFDQVYANDDFASKVKANGMFQILSEVPKGIQFNNTTFNMDQWIANFEFDPAQPVESRPVLIIKYGRWTIADLVEKKGLTDELTTASNQKVVKAFIEKLNKKPIDNEHYAYVKGILNDPYWNGIIGLNIKLKPNSLPLELQRTVPAGSVHWDIIGIKLPNSPLLETFSPAFGLIDYTTPESIQLESDSSRPYIFRKLFLTFRNSRLVHNQIKVEVKQDLATSFWAKNGVAFSGYELDEFSKDSPGLYKLDGAIMKVNGTNRCSFTGKNGRSGNALLNHLLSSKQK